MSIESDEKIITELISEGVSCIHAEFVCSQKEAADLFREQEEALGALARLVALAQRAVIEGRA
jgi:hypothetical protein